MGTNVQFTDNSVEIKQQINQKSLRWLEEVASELETQAIRNTKTDTAQTKRHWKHYVESREGKAYIGNELQNALWEEFGTGEFALKGNGRRTPWYVPVNGYLGRKKPTYNGKVVVVHGKNGTAFYKTNGKKPNRSLTKAFEIEKTRAIRRAEQIFGGP